MKQISVNFLLLVLVLFVGCQTDLATPVATEVVVEMGETAVPIPTSTPKQLATSTPRPLSHLTDIAKPTKVLPTPTATRHDDELAIDFKIFFTVLVLGKIFS